MKTQTNKQLYAISLSSFLTLQLASHALGLCVLLGVICYFCHLLMFLHASRYAASHATILSVYDFVNLQDIVYNYL